MLNSREQMNIVIVGHVDHGKSTVIGRLLADTNSLPVGKLEQVKATCEKNAKPFEYAFLLDALKDERTQGITIDTARCFFKTAARDYIILDAPGHIEFLKNMVTGASRAEAALLVIDAKEGVRENTKRHGLVLSMLGIRQVVVLVNKMDLVDYSEEVFAALETETRAFLLGLNVQPIRFIPIAAFHGDNLARASAKTPWYKGPTVLEQLDAFKNREMPVKLPFRFPVQDIYKFTETGDDRRIIAGTVETGTITVGDDVTFLPSGKRSVVQSVEHFNRPESRSASAGQALGFTLTTQLYIQPGEMMVKTAEAMKPKTSARFKVNLFWVGRLPMVQGKVYKLKLSTGRVPVKLVEIVRVVDAGDLSAAEHGQSIKRHDVATCVLETLKPLAYDLTHEIEGTSRFVIVDQYEIAGGGVISENVTVEETILEKHVKVRETQWERGSVNAVERSVAYSHQGKLILVVGGEDQGLSIPLAKKLERKLFDQGCKVYYLGLTNLKRGLGADHSYEAEDREEMFRRLGELGHIFTDAGQILVTAISEIDESDLEKLRKLITPYDLFVVGVGAHPSLDSRLNAEVLPSEDSDSAVRKICQLLKQESILFEYNI